MLRGGRCAVNGMTAYFAVRASVSAVGATAGTQPPPGALPLTQGVPMGCSANKSPAILPGPNLIVDQVRVTP